MRNDLIQKTADLADFKVERQRAGGLCWQVRTALARPELQEILRDPDGFLASGSPLLKKDHAAWVGAGHGYVVKRTNRRKFWKVALDVFRRSRGRQAFLRALAFERNLIATARAVATADRRAFGFTQLTYLITEEIPSATNLAKWRGDKALAIESVARLVASLHDAGYRHADLKAENILFDSSGCPYLIDLDAVRHFHVKVPLLIAARDVARLWRIKQPWNRYDRRDAVRFLRIYCELRGFSDVRRWWKRITRTRK